jgi:hypothetical protein
MSKQSKNLIALVLLIIATGISYRYNRIVMPTPSVAKATAAAKAALADNPLKARFRRVRAEMDGLYHYRIKPVPFDTSSNPFRLSGMGIATAPPPSAAGPKPAADASGANTGSQEFGEALLTHALSQTKLGGVVVMNDITQLTVDGQLHKAGDVFTAKVQSRLVLIRIKELTSTFVTFSLDDPEAGSAEMKVRLK